MDGDARSQERAWDLRAAAPDRRRRHAGLNTADGLEQLVHPLQSRHRAAHAHAADAMVASGMADYGYQYVNIDNCWMKKKGDEPYRDDRGAILPNSKFPDIKGMVDYIHAKGLKAGLYTSPGPWTCGGYVASYEHEGPTPRSSPHWGFDFLKHDWCSYTQVAGGKDLEHLQTPYRNDGRHSQARPRTSSTISANMAWGTCGSGAPRSAAIAGAPPAIWAWNGATLPGFYASA